jgi:hypothetical protein
LLSDDKIERLASILKEVTDIVREGIANDIPEPPVGTVITFQRVWRGRGYHYAAVRSEPGWYLTGKAGNRPRTWVELQQFAGDAAMGAMVYSHGVRRAQGPNDIRARLLKAMPTDYRDWWDAK